MKSSNHNSTKLSSTTIIIICLFFALFFSAFNSVFTMQKVGFVFTFAILAGTSFLVLYHFMQSQRTNKIHLNIIAVSISLVLIFVAGLLMNPTSRALIAIFQLATILLFFVFATLIEWNDYKIKIARNLAILFVLLLPLLANMQYIGAHLAFALFFLLLYKKKSLINIAMVTLSIVLIYLTGARAVLLLLAATAVTFILWKFISKTRIRFATFFSALVVGLLGFIFVYPNLIYWQHFQTLNNWALTYTGGRLMSGRNDIWIVITDLVNQKPLLGHGTGILPADVSPVSMSTHNLYLQTALQNGYIGLVTLLILFFAVWMIYFKSRNTFETRLSASFFIGILVYQSFEVVLTQNKMDTALMFWLIISIGVSKSIYNEKKQT